mgnify:CR=1 FL=1
MIGNNIHIGDEWVTVPYGYLQAEKEYCEEETRAFLTATNHSDKENARSIVLAKRVEFYKKFKNKEVEIRDPSKKPKRSFWRNLIGKQKKTYLWTNSQEES